MTSANVTNHIIEKDGKIVGEHSQHHYCHTRWHRLYKYTPFKDYTITSIWVDEEENEHVMYRRNLRDFIANNPPKISDMKRMIEHIEKSHAILTEWVEKFGDFDKELKLRTLNNISHSPL